MVKRTRSRIFVATVVVALVGGIGAFGQSASDSVQLNLTGEVPSLVKIGFAGGESSVDFGDLSESPAVQTVDVQYLANVDFSISVSSANDGKLVRVGGPVTSFGDEVAYELTWGTDAAVTLEEERTVVSNGTPGSTTTPVELSVTDIIDLDHQFDTDPENVDIWAQGTYTDEVTFTITADE